MRIVIAGGTGFVGTPLVDSLQRDHSVAVLTRDPQRITNGLAWSDIGDAVAAADVVVNLAGDNIGSGRWTKGKKSRLIESRLGSTRRIVEALRSAPPRPRTLISASAVGFYGSRGDEILTEQSRGGNDFLAQLCRQWEEAALEAEGVARVVIFRFGVVLARGGALDRMMLPFRFFAGGPIGSGRQWMSWIDRRDAIGLLGWSIGAPAVSGIYNATAPNPVTNRELAGELGSILHRPSFLPAPAVALRLALGEMADSLLLASQRVIPSRALAEGYRFEFPSLSGSLRQILR